MTDSTSLFLTASCNYLSGDYLPKIELATAGLTREQLWWRANGPSNSIGNLLLHLSGNVRQWIVSGIGGAPDRRQRQQEFDERNEIERDELLTRLRTTVEEACAVIARVDPAQIGEKRRIQGREVSIFNAIYHVVEHFSMHTGQIILLAKMQAGAGISFYEVSADGVARPRWHSRRSE